jgi:hypothetical protein
MYYTNGWLRAPRLGLNDMVLLRSWKFGVSLLLAKHDAPHTND